MSVAFVVGLLTMIDGGLLNSRNSIIFLKLCAMLTRLQREDGQRFDGLRQSPNGRGSAIDTTSVCLDIRSTVLSREKIFYFTFLIFWIKQDDTVRTTTYSDRQSGRGFY